MCFFSRDPARRRRQEAILEDVVGTTASRCIGWRDVPVDAGAVGPIARESMPVDAPALHRRACRDRRRPFERTLFMIRKRAGQPRAQSSAATTSTSRAARRRPSSTRGSCSPSSSRSSIPTSGDDARTSQLALVHSRFSTNTFPTWERAHPFRLHRAQRRDQHAARQPAWMRAREALLESELFGEHIEDFKPIIRPGGSDSASLDNVVDFLVASAAARSRT